MFIVRSFFIAFCIFYSASVGFASESSQYIQKARELRLGDDPFWKSLLHFKGGRSQILDGDFFLSSRGNFDSEAELEATIEAYFSRKHKIKRESGDKDIVCIFPARYLWLNQKLGLPGYRCDAGVCPSLFNWARLDEIDSVSVIYVSGYLGNPASSFGHVILNLKLNNSEDLFGLYDTSVSYGATVPLHENVLFYVLKGLLGGYYASFSDKFFYTDDQVYSNEEYRDMWEYTLNLSNFEKKMFIFHIAELLTKRNRYFFLSANCAQRMAVLLSVIIDEQVYDHYYPVYVPEELFHRLDKIDMQRRLHSKPGLIKSIKYIPSARRYLFYETAALSKEEHTVYRNIVNSRDKDFRPLLQGINEQSRIRVLDALLAYQYYKLMASNEGKADKRLKEYKDKILLERLSLPIEKVKPVKIPEVPSPRDVSPPSSISLGYVVEKGNKPFTLLGATVFRKESVGFNALEYNELVALDVNLGIRPEDGDVFVDKFDFIRMRDFKTFYIPEANENQFSWRVRVGGDRYDIKDKVSYDYVLDGGAGLVRKAGNVGIYYGFLNASVHSIFQRERIGPSAGFILGGHGPLKLQLDYGLEFGLKNFVCFPVLQSKIQYQINKDNAIQLSYEYEKDRRKRFSINYIYYW